MSSHKNNSSHKKGQSDAIGRSMSESHFNITEDLLPEIKDWEVGKKYRIEIVAEQRSLGFEMFEGETKEARFLIKSAKATGKQPVK